MEVTDTKQREREEKFAFRVLCISLNLGLAQKLHSRWQKGLLTSSGDFCVRVRQAQVAFLDCSCGDLEVGLEGPDGGVVSTSALDGHVVGEGRSDGGHIEAEGGGPVLLLVAEGREAVGAISGAGEGLVVDGGAHEDAGEVDVIHVSAGLMPDTLNDEVLGVVGLNGIGVGVGEVVVHLEDVGTGGLVDHDGVSVDGGSRLDVLLVGELGHSGVENGLQHFKIKK